MTKTQAATKFVRLLRGGQITIPAEYRKRLGIEDDTLLQMTLDGDELRLKPVRLAERPDRSDWLKELYDYFAPVRQEILDRGTSEEELDRDIDAAIRAVRERG